MKIGQAAALAAAAYEKGYTRGGKEAARREQRRFKMVTQADRQQTIDVITEMFGIDVAADFVERKREREQTGLGRALGAIETVMESLGMDPADAQNLRKVFDEQDGNRHTMVFELPPDEPDQEKVSDADYPVQMAAEESDLPMDGEDLAREQAHAAVRRHAQEVAEAVERGDDPSSVVTDDPVGDKEAALAQ
jgi:hypothetical protein